MQVSLARIYRPRWLKALVRRMGAKQPRTVKPGLQASDADTVWRECIGRDLYGANTAEYTIEADVGSKPR